MVEDSPVSASGGDPHDPFRTDLPASPAERRPSSPTPSDQPPNDPKGTAPELSRRMAVRLTVQAIASVATAFLAPPVGAALGLVTVVQAARAGGRVATRTRVLTIVASAVAIVVGVAATAVGLAFRTEITDFSQCSQAANTQLAQQNCQDSLNDALRSRLGL